MDINAIRAMDFQMTKPEFFEMLCQVEKEKYLAIAEVKSMFSKRMRFIVGAKDYEIRCERQIGFEACRKFIRARMMVMQQQFMLEVTRLLKEHSAVRDRIRFYEELNKKQHKTMALQEMIIGKLSSSLFKTYAVEEGNRIAKRKTVKSNPLEFLAAGKPTLKEPYVCQ
jgi:hypothetical protein